MDMDSIVAKVAEISGADLKNVKIPRLCSFFTGCGAITDKFNEMAAEKQ